MTNSTMVYESNSSSILVTGIKLIIIILCTLHMMDQVHYTSKYSSLEWIIHVMDCAIKVAILGRNKLGFVDGSIIRETYGSAPGHL